MNVKLPSISLVFSLVLLVFAAQFAPLTVFSQTPPPAANAGANRNIRISVTPNPVRMGESVSVRISVNISGNERIEAPVFNHPNFDLIDQSVSRRITTVVRNGSYVPKQENTYTYILHPKKAGELSIKNISVKVGEKNQYLSNQFVVVKAPSGSSPTRIAGQNPRSSGFRGNNQPSQRGQSPKNSRYRTSNNTGSAQEEAFPLNSDFTVRLKLSKNKAYVGEPIVAEYYLYDFNNLHKIDIKKWPTFDGFWKEDLEIPTRFNFENAYVGDRRVRRALLGRFSLYPLKAGKIKIDKLIVNGMYSSNMQRGRRNSPFDMFFGHRSLKKASHASQNEAVTIIEIPEENQPANFEGAVGSFEISLSTDKQKVKANEPITFTFKVSGEGNVHEVEEPKIVFPDEFDLYESKTKVQNLAPRGVRIALKKSKTFELLVLPRKQGTYTVEALEWNYFDPKSRSYKVLTTEPIAIEVGPGNKTDGTNNVIIAGTDASGTTVSATPKVELRYLKSPDSLTNKSSLNFGSLLERIATGVFSLNFFLLGLLIWRRKDSLIDLSALKNSRTAQVKRAIASIDNALSSKTNTYGELHESIRMLLLALIESENKGLTKLEISEAWKEKRFSEKYLNHAFDILENCDTARFARDKAADKANLKEISKQVRLMVKQTKNL